MENNISFSDAWDPVVSAIHARVSDAKTEYGDEARGLEVIEQPARTVVIQANRPGSPLVQASISPRGDTIEIKRQVSTAGMKVNEEPETIEIEVKNGTVAYIHDDTDRTTDPNKVADIILGVVLDFYRKAS